MFVVVDAVHQRGLADDLVKMGVLPGNVFVWSRNGIEYFYPADTLAPIFKCSRDRTRDLVIQDDVVELNNIHLTKAALNERVVSNLSADTVLPTEIEDFLGAIRTAIE